MCTFPKKHGTVGPKCLFFIGKRSEFFRIFLTLLTNFRTVPKMLTVCIPALNATENTVYQINVANTEYYLNKSDKCVHLNLLFNCIKKVANIGAV